MLTHSKTERQAFMFAAHPLCDASGNTFPELDPISYTGTPQNYVIKLIPTIEYVVAILARYLDPSGQYLIAHEISELSHEETDGHHYHVIADMSVQKYHSFAKYLFKDKWNLNGRATKNRARQYGKIKIVRDWSKMFSYTMKDDNFITNFTARDLKLLQEQAFKKPEEDEDTKIFNLLLSMIEGRMSIETPVGIADFVLGYYMKHYPTRNPSRTMIHRLALRYFLHSEKDLGMCKLLLFAPNMAFS